MKVQHKKYYLSEFQLYDGDHLITMNIVDINTEKQEITVAITDEGKISVHSFDLKSNNGCLFFEYGIMHEQIAVDDFEQVED